MSKKKRFPGIHTHNFIPITEGTAIYIEGFPLYERCIRCGETRNRLDVLFAETFDGDP